MFDVVICLGPNDYSYVNRCLESIRSFVKGVEKIYIITQECFIKSSSIKDVFFINENTFPFTKETVEKYIRTSERSGWYLQQLLKIYSPIIIKELNDNFLIIDSDVIFHNEISFFEKKKIQFNICDSIHKPYFDHMLRVHRSLRASSKFSGISHILPMKRRIVESLLSMVENDRGKKFWTIFLESIDPIHKLKSGASEYEILFHYSLRFYKDDCEIRPLLFKNSNHISESYEGIYEAVHWYMRPI